MQETYNNIDEALDALFKEVEMEHNDTSLALNAYHSVQKKLGLSAEKPLWGNVLRWSQRVALLLVLPLAIGFALLLSKTKQDIEWKEINVDNGAKQELTLSDGTSLVMYAGSRLTYPTSFDKKVREIFIDGEVYADVAHDKKDKPFVIYAGDVSIQVLGTKFNLKAYKGAEEVNVHLLEGSVRLDVKDGLHDSSYMVRPGQSVVFNRKDGTLKSYMFDVDTYRTIREEGQIEFDNMTILDIAAELERMFGNRIVVADKKLAARRMTAFFQNDESLDEILSSLNMDGKMDIDADGGTFFLSSHK